MTVEHNLKKLNILLPKAADPVGSYVATKISGKMLFIADFTFSGSSDGLI